MKLSGDCYGFLLSWDEDYPDMVAIFFRGTQLCRLDILKVMALGIHMEEQAENAMAFSKLGSFIHGIEAVEEAEEFFRGINKY